MSGYADVYALAPERSAMLVRRFLDSFARAREFSAEQFAVHDVEGGEHLFTSWEAAIEFCSDSPHMSTSLYWRSLSSPWAHLMVFFLGDGHLVFGVSTSEAEAETALAALRRFCGPRSHGYIAFEEAPPDTAAEFLSLCR